MFRDNKIFTHNIHLLIMKKSDKYLHVDAALLACKF